MSTSMSNDILGEIINTLEELKRMHQLNSELLDQLNVACGWLLKSQINLPNIEKFASLVSKATLLLEEINTKPSDEISQRKSSDKDYTEPAVKLYK